MEKKIEEFEPTISKAGLLEIINKYTAEYNKGERTESNDESKDRG